MKRALILLLIGCGSAGANPASPPRGRAELDVRPVAEGPGSRRPTSIEQGAIDRLMQAAVAIRELTFAGPVSVEIETATYIAGHLDGQIEDEDVQRAEAVYGALGLLEPGTDVRALLTEVLGEQVVGYYDTDGERLVVRDDVMRLLASRPGSQEATEAAIVIVHELVHALQDQRLRLGELYEQERDTDADGALRSLVEGDATLAMILHAAADAGLPTDLVVGRSAAPADLSQLAGMMPTGPDQALSRAPAILRVTLVAPYLAGLSFVAQEHAAGGGWGAIDADFASPPQTMEQVLHPDRRHEAPEPVVLPALPELEAAGFHVVEEDTLGELELGVYLALGTPADIDTTAADGWGGDRLRVYQRGDERVAIWFLTFDDDGEATEAEAAARRSGGEVKRVGRSLSIFRGVPPDLIGEPSRVFSHFAAGVDPRRARTPSRIAP